MKLSFFKRESPEKKFQETLDKYQKAAEENPGDLRLRVKVAELYLEHGKKDDAISEYLVAAQAYCEKRVFQIAVAIYKHIISVDPDHIEVYTKLADLHLRNGFVGDSVAVLEKLATLYYGKDMKYEATQVISKIREIDPDNKFFEIKVAKFYESKNLSEEETLREGPKDKWELLGGEKPSGNLQLGADESFFDLEAALTGDMSINISTVSEEETEAPEASSNGMAPDTVFKDIKSMMESAPDQDSPQFHYNLGMAYQRCNQIEEALEEFQTALGGVEDKVECCIRVADCGIALNKFDKAHDVIDSMLKAQSLSDKEKLDLLYQSGLVYKAEGDSKKALKVFKKIYASDKNYKAVGMQISQLSQQ
jgi:tetratricopeptide (TPR) repeat protein